MLKQQVNKIKNLRLTLRLKIRTRLILGFRIKSENTLNKIKNFDFQEQQQQRSTKFECSSVMEEQPAVAWCGSAAATVEVEEKLCRVFRVRVKEKELRGNQGIRVFCSCFCLNRKIKHSQNKTLKIKHPQNSKILKHRGIKLYNLNKSYNNQ